ncbi:MAG: hypothetical protein KGN32_06795 [Burkholderiales bacterium]|nr:hypothetical protein [Burkholderiales bacterium]
MSKKPEKPKSERSPSARVPDYLLDPVPVPDVVESDSDTAWGLWQDSVQSIDGSETRPSGDSIFGATLPSELAPVTPVKRRSGN